ncbi:RNA 2',3'-cyclic phosphodiesterase [Streptomyces sp. NPDC102360]|uniref:RNA 2',3'-cyclic phosphodiesterase n=1 Tax=Streptomyces sp. NPDC102360 TaxID=3366160 RepID=UPI00382A3352
MTEPAESAATLRAFIALAPPDDAKEELARALRPVYAAHPRLRQNRIEDWHITLAFLGEQSAATVQRLLRPLADLAAGRPSPELALRGGGHFDDRVLWTGVEGDLDELHLLSEAVRKQIRTCGVDFPERPLRPHLTLARARRHDTTSVPEASAALETFTGRRWPALRLHLVAGAPGTASTPRRYQDIGAWELAGGPEAGSAEPPRT